MLDGSLFDLPTPNHQVVLVVNTASQCGFAKQFQALQKLYDQYHHQGFTVLGVSSQSFGKQEFDLDCQVEVFVKQQTPSMTFPITQLTAVRGENSHPFYAWIASQVPWLGRPRWNFYKYLIGRNFQLLNWFWPITDPLSKKVIHAIQRALQE